MFSFSKKKKETAPASGTGSELIRAMRTMKDDLEGVPLETPAEVPAPVTPSFENTEKSPENGSPAEHKTAPAPANLPGSPFLSTEDEEKPLEQGIPEENPTPPPSPEPASTSFFNNTGSPSPSPSLFSKKKKYILGGAVLLISLILAGSGWYFFMMRGGEKETGESISALDKPVAPQAPETPSPGEPVEKEARFSPLQPNILSINTETVTAETLRTMLREKAMQVKEDGHTEAIEFIVRDQNFNPLAFSRFALLVGMNLPETLLAETNENFSIYAYADKERPRLGLSVDIKDAALFQKELLSAEKSLPGALDALYIDTTTAPMTGLLFRSGSYNGLTTRYTNIDAELPLSVDYALRGQEWYVGTSQSTLRVMLDKTANLTSPAIPNANPAPQIPPST